MKVFKDAFSNDELFSDSYPMKEIEGVVYEVEGKFFNKTLGGESFDIGANASEEEANETYETQTVRVINVIDAHRLQPTSFDKKSYLSYIKAYMKRLKTHLESSNPARASEFQTGAQNFVKTVLGNFSNYEFFTGENMDLDAMVVLLGYKEDGVTPYLYFFKDGLIEEKY
eukprot:TRINITY_DN1768_c0_g1_i1.p1 TRINITY_DN1768_c0_g1~~TRINITY_DN1768_c0_g1_i1.p1  ORF type:complete len:170 (+),score=50.62 TRINITY_DN1768_c0_g1_i1:159-668(+)